MRDMFTVRGMVPFWGSTLHGNETWLEILSDCFERRRMVVVLKRASESGSSPCRRMTGWVTV